MPRLGGSGRVRCALPRVRVVSATELAALDFPQPVQASVLADAQSAEAGARQDAPHLARNAVPGHPASLTF